MAGKRTDIIYRVSDLSDPLKERVICSFDSLANAQKAISNPEFVDVHRLIGKELAITMLRDEPLTVPTSGARLCPHCNKSLEEVGLTFEEKQLSKASLYPQDQGHEEVKEEEKPEPELKSEPEKKKEKEKEQPVVIVDENREEDQPLEVEEEGMVPPPPPQPLP